MISEPVRSGTLDPDHGEEANDLDDVVPSCGYRLTPVVGLGGSAGSIRALQSFLKATPADSGLAFVVVLHLAPEHDSTLDRLLQSSTSMPVKQAIDGGKILPDHVYVIPPGKVLSLSDGHLRLSELPRERGRRMTVDLFFRSLADTHAAHAVAVVLSGDDGDGAIGIKRIKERGGLTIAQNPEEAEHSGMPRSAIATGMVDWVLDIEEVPARVREYQARERRLQLPSELGSNPVLSDSAPTERDEALREVLTFLHARSGRDFSYYKRATVVRRIARRMQVNGVDNISEYLSYLRLHPGEAGALQQDLLISVTNFFRDSTAFEALAAQIPELFRDKIATDTIRVWVPACASGEEAYSVAMLLSDHARTLLAPPSFQIFATDLDDAVVAQGRAGLYPTAIAADVSADQLERYFVKEHRGYRVKRELREVVLFAVHDLLKDSPFSHLDLVSCRNLMIYLSRDAQQRALRIFHYALRNDGRLFLGTSESITESEDLFRTVAKNARIFAARQGARNSSLVPSRAATIARTVGGNGAAGQALALRGQSPTSASELHLKLIERLAPPSLVVDANDEILHLSHGASAFLELTGELSMGLFHVVRPALRAELRAALLRVRDSGEPSAIVGIAVEIDGQRRTVNLHVSSAADVSPGAVLVAFDLQATRGSEPPPSKPSEPAAQRLELELEQTRRQLRSLEEQRDESIEQLKASNEELQAINEELRSASEELETSREELQSMNEELTMVNFELKAKVDELGHSNAHLHNLMGATAIPMIFLDGELRIMRYTPPAVALFNLIPSDIGRPLAHLRHSLDYPTMLQDARQVVDAVAPTERDIAGADGRFFIARLLPYRMLDDQVGGVVLTFVDVTELQLAQRALQHARQELEQRVIDRTAQLDQANAALRAEVVMHQRAEKARQDLQRRLVDAQEQERSRISRELHDEVGQQITALMLALKGLESEEQVDKAKAKLVEMRAITEGIGREVHQLAAELRPLALDELGLSRALSSYLDTWSARTGIAVDFVCTSVDDARLPGVAETTLYRIVQEATNNVFKHAAAGNVSVSLELRSEGVVMIVEDDGAGFDLDALPESDFTRIGVAGMRERAEVAGGSLTVESHLGGGTTVRAKLPIPA